MKEKNPTLSTCFLFNRDDMAAKKNPILGADSYSFWFNQATGHVISICKEHRGDPLHPTATHLLMLYVHGVLNEAIQKFVFADFGFDPAAMRETDDPQASQAGFRAFVCYVNEASEVVETVEPAPVHGGISTLANPDIVEKNECLQCGEEMPGAKGSFCNPVCRSEYVEGVSDA